MPKKRVFISSRVEEMRQFREAAVRAIEAAGMEPVSFDSTDPEECFPLKLGTEVMRQLVEGVKTSDAFVGLYGDTLNSNWKPQGHDKHSMELEYDAAEAAGIPCLCHVLPSDANCDEDMARFRKRVMRRAVDFLTTPGELYDNLLARLRSVEPRIFVSYSSKDQDFVDRLYVRLKESGHYAWLNTESIPKGETWYDEMLKGLKDTDVMILVISPDSLASKWVKQEWETFLGAHKKLFPLLYRNAKVPKQLNAIEMIKAEGDDWYYKLLKCIEQSI